MLCIEVQLIFACSTFGTNKSLFIEEECEFYSFAAFSNIFLPLTDFISPPNCSRCSSLNTVAFAFSSTLTTSFAGLCLFDARCALAA